MRSIFNTQGIKSRRLLIRAQFHFPDIAKSGAVALWYIEFWKSIQFGILGISTTDMMDTIYKIIKVLGDTSFYQTSFRRILFRAYLFLSSIFINVRYCHKLISYLQMLTEVSSFFIDCKKPQYISVEHSMSWLGKKLVMFMNVVPACTYVHHMPCTPHILRGQRRASDAVGLEL